MFSPEEQARINRKALAQIEALAAESVRSIADRIDAELGQINQLNLTRDDRFFLKQLHISAE